MRIFAIKNEKHRKRPAQSWLIYDEETDNFSIRISRNADKEDLPLMLICAVEKGQYELGDRLARRFVSERIIPSERQNLGSIMAAHGMDHYDVFDFLMIDMGRCSQDDCYLEEVDEMEPKRSLSYLIAEERKKSGLTQAQLSERCGIKQSNLSRIENGTSEPTIETLELIAKGLGKELKIYFS